MVIWAIAVSVLCFAIVGFAVWKAQRALGRSESQLRSAGQFAVAVQPVTPAPNPGFEALPAPGIFKAGASFEGKFYLSGPAGLYEYSTEGVLQHIYRCGLELPAAPLGQIAVGTLADAHQPELLIATSGEGVLAFDGHNFRQLRAAAPEARQITALLPLASGRLLLGTAKLGLLVYDGQTLRAFHPTTSGIYVTALAGTESDLWIGTLDRGVLHWRGGQTEQISEAQGLPDARVEAISGQGDSVYVGTPVGVAEMRGGKVARVLAPGTYAHALLAQSETLLVGEFEGGILSVGLAGPAANGSPRRAIAFSSLQSDQRRDSASPASVEQFLAAGPDLYAIENGGVLHRNPDGGWSKILSATDGLLTDRDISALLPAPDGRLWIGYFDRGLDILPAAGGVPQHIENDRVFCVNRIVDEPRMGAVAVATANGLAMFSPDGRQRQILDRDSGLIASHVTDVVPYGQGLAAATPAGITFLDATGAHSLYAFEGLVNNHVYALGVRGDQLLAGTLGGISLLTNGQVRQNLTTANSGLKANWITAMARIGDGWLVGTYGYGVMRLDDAGNVTATEAARNGVVVNPGALLSDGRLTLAGTMGQGLLVGDATGTRWKWVTAGLPSLNVTALAVDKGVVYVGTDNGLVRIDEDKL